MVVVVKKIVLSVLNTISLPSNSFEELQKVLKFMLGRFLSKKLIVKRD